MSVRVLTACTVALMLLLALMGLAAWADWPMGGRSTRYGLVPTWELAAIAVAMGVGGTIARAGFRPPAAVLVAVAWLARLAAAWMFAPAGTAGAGGWLLRNNLLALIVSVAAAWVAAGAGERLGARLGRRQSAG